MLAEQNVVKLDIIRHDGQFISVQDIITLLSKCLTGTHRHDIYTWLSLHQDELEQAFPLIKVKANKIIPYSLYIQTFFNYGHSSPKISPIECLELVINGGYIEDFADYEDLGFSKYKTLMLLQSLGIEINRSYWKDVTPYIPPRSMVDEHIEPYYLERIKYLEDLVRHLSQEKINQVQKNKLPFKIEVLLKAHHFIHILGRYSGEKDYKTKVKFFIEEMAHTDDRYKSLITNATFIDSMVNFLRSETREYIANFKK